MLWKKSHNSIGFESFTGISTDVPLERVDEVMFYELLASLSGYLIMGFVCLAMDLLLPVKTRIAMKAQGEGSKPFSAKEWFDALKRSLFNLFFVAPVFSFPLFFFQAIICFKYFVVIPFIFLKHNKISL